LNKKKNKYDVPRFVPEELQQLIADAKPEIFQIADFKIWCLYNPEILFANSIIIEGEDGVILIDTGISRAAGEYIKGKIDELTEKPLTTIIYTHHHYDHVNGTNAIVTREQVANKEIKILAAHNFISEYTAENVIAGPIMAWRASYGYGHYMDKEEQENFLIGGMMAKPSFGTGVYIPPNTLLEEKQDLEINGVKMHIFHTGGEAATEIAIYLPDLKILFCADEVYPSNPNLHSLRGTKPRDANKWIKAIDKMRQFEIEHLVGSHGKPVIGKEKIDEVLLYYRDIIQYQHDQAVRFINHGYTYKDLAEKIPELPDYLKYPPYSSDYYGHIKHNVPEYFVSYISWFAGDPIDLQPTPAKEKATKLVELMGGQEKVLAEADKLFSDDKSQLAAELATLLIAKNTKNINARKLKAACFRKIGYQQVNSWWRAWYLTSALELEMKLDIQGLTKKRQELLRGWELVSSLSLEQIYSRFRYCVDPLKAKNKNMIMGMIFTDTEEQFSLELRHSVLIHSEDIPDDADVVLIMTRDLLNQILTRECTFLNAIAQKRIQVNGKKTKLLEFFKCLDLNFKPIFLTLGLK